MGKKDITSIRGTIEFLREQGELLVIDKEVDPILEIAGIQKALEGGLPILFENVKGYPGIRDVGNLIAREETAAKIFDVADHRKFKFKCHQALKNPLPPSVVKDAPCHEVIITDDIDVPATLPIIKHSEHDIGRILGSANILLSGEYFDNGSELVFKRMHFRGKDWSSVFVAAGTLLARALQKFKGEKVPVTINIGTPPAVLLMAGGGGIYPILSYGADKLAIAGGIQGSPVDVVKAKTVDAYAVANSEWVIEGYIDTAERVWESEEAEKTGKSMEVPFFPEWPGYLGRCYRANKFQATAITHRKDPIFYTPLAQSFEGSILGTIIKEAAIYEFCERIAPGLVTDVHILPGVAAWAHVLLQVRKRGRGDEGVQRALITGILGSIFGMKLVVVVDDDVDIYSADDVIWAITTRTNAESGIIIGGGGPMMGMMPGERVRPSGEQVEISFLLQGGIGIDATLPFAAKWRFERADYPSDKIDLSKWLSPGDIARVRAVQTDYAKLLARTGH
ncbi:UbiD family decarboxylase domain-containing protein [Chloroflexota bacterium]